MNSVNPELDRPRLDYEERLVEYQAKNRIAERLMQKKISEIDLQAQARMANLKNTERAMLNILEDAQILGGRLKEQKAKVEQEVKERTRELREEQSRLLASIDSLSWGFIIADLDHKVIINNKAMAALFGLGNQDEISIEDIARVLGKDFDIKKEAERCVKGGKVCEIKEIIFGKKFLRSIIAPILMTRDHGELIGYVLLFEDITEAKVVERSREEFFAVASHELRTPLTAIRGNSEMIQEIYKDKIVDKDMAGMLADITEASIRLIDIVNDFLDISRLEQGKVAFKKESVDLLLIVKEACKDIEPLAKTKSLTFALIEPKEASPLVLADKIRLKEVIFNLLDNAVKYTNKGAVTVIVERSDKFMVVSVRDTGGGISLKNQALLFRKFQQAGEEMLTRDVSKSTGLGLYISKLLMEGMGGAIGLTQSAIGEGSTFQLTIPIAL